MHQETRRPVFAEAQAACGRLGLRLTDLDATTRGYFEIHASAVPIADGPERAPEADVQTLQRAVAQAADETEPENDPPFFEGLLGDPAGYHYAGLLRVINGDVSGKPTRQR